MIPSDLAARLRMLTEASFFDSEPPVQGTARVREIQARLPQLVPGQQFSATLMRALPDGTFQAIVAGRNYTLALNHPAQSGDKLDLIVTRSTGNTVFAQLAPAQTGTAAAETARANLSPTGRLISFLLTGQPAPSPAQLAEGRPLLQTPPAPGSSAVMAPLLRQALSQSGLFYEAHQHQWLAGQRDTVSLRQEPQGKEAPATRHPSPASQGPGIATAGGGTGASATSPSAVQTAAAAATAGRTSAPGTTETQSAAGNKQAPAAGSSLPPAPGGRNALPVQQPPVGLPDGRVLAHAPKPAGPPPSGVADPGREAPKPSLRTAQEQAAKYVEVARSAGLDRPIAGAGRTAGGEPVRMSPVQLSPAIAELPGRAPPGQGLPAGAPPAATQAPPQPPAGPGGLHSTATPSPTGAGSSPGSGSATAAAQGSTAQGAGETGSRPAPTTQDASQVAAAARTPMVPERLIPVVHQQLDAMATQQYVWHGQAWPGQAIEWEIEDPRREGGEPGEEQADSWNTTLRLVLPRLGGVEARLQLTPAGLALRILADDPATVAALDAAQGRLDSALAAADVPLTGFLAEQRHEP